MAKPPGEKSNHTMTDEEARYQLLKTLPPGIEKVQAYLNQYREHQKNSERQDWHSTLLPHLSVVSYSSDPPHPRITMRFVVQYAHSNGQGSLHGGCAGTVFDLCTSLPLCFIARPGFWQLMGVSRTLSVTYLRPVPVGSVVHIECELVHVGRKLCATRGVMRMATEGKDGEAALGPVLAICEHGKANSDPPAEKL